jgi:hypothetical protein
MMSIEAAELLRRSVARAEPAAEGIRLRALGQRAAADLPQFKCVIAVEDGEQRRRELLGMPLMSI